MQGIEDIPHEHCVLINGHALDELKGENPANKEVHIGDLIFHSSENFLKSQGHYRSATALNGGAIDEVRASDVGTIAKEQKNA